MESTCCNRDGPARHWPCSTERRLTHWRTAAASALAARHLARADAQRLLIVGAGALAPCLARAHASQRSYRAITVWNRRAEGALRVAETLQAEGLSARAAEDLEGAIAEADVISVKCDAGDGYAADRGPVAQAPDNISISSAPSPCKCAKADDEALKRARIFVDTEAACTDGGDVAVGLATGAIAHPDVVMDLPGLCRGAKGRRSDDEITLFKSVGAAIEDLAAAILVWKKAGGEEPRKGAGIAIRAPGPLHDMLWV